MKNLLKMKKGFTLIELLVVIAIIGILAALIIVSLSGARLRAQDTQTKNNTRSLSTALEQYYTDQTTGAYPTSTSQVAFNNATVTGALGTYASGGANSQIFTGYTGLTNGYITSANGASYLAAAGLRNTTEGTVEIGNGEWCTDGAATGPTCPGTVGTVTAGSIVANSLTLIDIRQGGTNSNTGRAWVVYGPQ